MMQNLSTKICLSTMCPVSPKWSRCLLMQNPSIRICPSGMCPTSPTCGGCLLMQIRSSKFYVAQRGSIRMRPKLTCLSSLPARYRRQCVVRVCIGILFLYSCCFHVSPTRSRIVTSKRCHAHSLIHVIFITSLGPANYPHAHLHNQHSYTPDTNARVRSSVLSSAQTCCR